MADHTPGYWQYGCADDGYFIANGDHRIPDIAARIPSEADASLIAAAPDMLEALQLIVDAYSIGSFARQTASAAIAKATGVV